MKKTIGILCTTAAAALSVTAAATGSPQSAAACVAGVKKINGATARTFCGPAKARVQVNGKTITYKGGECSKSAFGWSINIGTVVIGTAPKKPDYFGIAARPKAGSQRDGAATLVHLGKGLSALGTTTLKPGLKSGTFTGKVFGEPTRVTASFTC